MNNRPADKQPTATARQKHSTSSRQTCSFRGRDRPDGRERQSAPLRDQRRVERVSGTLEAARKHTEVYPPESSRHPLQLPHRCGDVFGSYLPTKRIFATSFNSLAAAMARMKRCDVLRNCLVFLKLCFMSVFSGMTRDLWRPIRPRRCCHRNRSRHRVDGRTCPVPRVLAVLAF